MQIKNSRFIIFTLGVLSAIGPFSIDMYLPAFPAMAVGLSSTIPHVQLSLTSYFIGIALGQLFYGPVIDRFGRLVPLFGGLAIYLIASIICAFASSVDSLILLRFFQALGACAGMVVARAMVRDIFPVSENAKIFSLLMLVSGISPILAPTLGGYMSAGFGWRSIFFFLTALSVLTILVSYKFLFESKPADKEMSLKPKSVLADFATVLKEPQFIFYTLAAAMASAGMFAYISGSTYVFIEMFGVSEKQYGWLFGLNATGLILASQLNGRLLIRTTSQKIIKTVSLVQLLAAFTMFCLAFTGVLNIYSTLMVLFFYMSAQGFLFPNSSALAMAPFSKRAGIASALLGSFQMMFSAVASFAVSFLHNHTAVPMTAVILFCASCSFILIRVGQHHMKKSSSPA